MTTPQSLAAAIARDIQPEPGGGFSLYVPGHPSARGRAKAHLDGMILFRGSATRWLAVVRTLISEGRTVEIREGKPTLVAPDGCYLLVSKTAADFARFLVASRE